jgi:hypothetical protein|tara:strand:+ start:1005 stop:1595 length:591 start_codon:yes stop_codon:yes gene_type:complete
MEKKIVADCDGVLLNWEYAFDCWMNEKGFYKLPGTEDEYHIGNRYGITTDKGRALVKEFNQSAAIGFLPALRDAAYYVKLLHEKHGYVFDVVTSLSKSKYAAKLRERNLDKIFGENVFRRVVCLDTGADKDDCLQELYADGPSYYWIEDKVSNAVAGAKVGMKPILVEHAFNMNEKLDFPILKNWEEIYNYILDNG